MRNLAHRLDVTAPEELASHRHRPARAEAFPAPAEVNYEAREAAYLRSLLADPLREIACATTDANARAIAEAASEATASEPFADLAGLEDALEQIATTTIDDAARTIAEDAVALYRGR